MNQTHVRFKVVDLLRWLLRKLPIIGGLADCTAKDHTLAVKEFFFAVAFSTATFSITALIMSVLSQYSSTSFTTLLLKTVSNGELLIFSVSFAGPIFVTAMQDRQGKSPFPGAIWHVFALGVFAVTASILFALLKIQGVIPGTNLKLDMDSIRSTSYFIAVCALLLRYTTFVYQKMLVASDALGPKQDKDFADRFAAHAENQGR